MEVSENAYAEMQRLKSKQLEGQHLAISFSIKVPSKDLVRDPSTGKGKWVTIGSSRKSVGLFLMDDYIEKKLEHWNNLIEYREITIVNLLSTEISSIDFNGELWNK